jgi:hypothetical protein
MPSYWSEQITEGAAVMVKKRFSRSIRVNITPFFSLLLRKKGKKSREGVAVAESPTAASATGSIVFVSILL